MAAPPLAADPASALSTPRREFVAGARSQIALLVGGIPFGIIFGALAVASGVSPTATLLLSMIVFAGSAQFIGVSLIAAAASVPVIMLTTFVVNVRHALYAATLAPHVRHLPTRWLVALGFMLTDESFATVSAHYANAAPSPHKHWYFLGANLAMYISWQLSTIVGIIAGGRIDDPLRWGLDFTMTATFTAIVVPAITTRPLLAAVVTAGVVSVFANPLPNKLGLLVAAFAGIAAGVLAEGRVKPTESAAS